MENDKIMTAPTAELSPEDLAMLAAKPGAEIVYISEDMEEPKEETPTVH